MKVSVGNTPQAVFPDPTTLTDLTLYNMGPYTIFVDENSAINPGQSTPIYPTGSIVWDKRKPLWVVAEQLNDPFSQAVTEPIAQSVLRIVPNSSPPEPGRANTFDLLYLSNQGTLNQTRQIIECVAYQSIRVGIRHANSVVDSTPASGTGVYNVDVHWLDDTGTYTVAKDKSVLWVPPAINDGNVPYYQTVNLNRKSNRFRVLLSAAVPSNFPSPRVVVYGSNQPLAQEYTEFHPDIAYTVGGVLTPGFKTFAVSNLSMASSAINFQAPTPNLEIVMSWSAAVTAAGTFLLYNGSIAGTSLRYMRGAISVIAGAHEERYTVKVPTSVPLQWYIPIGPTGGGNLDMEFTFS